MSSFPACNVCRKEFTSNGPAPFVLPCLHAVCEACVSSNSVIFCTNCYVSVNPKNTRLCKDLVRKRDILQLSIKKKPEDLLCTHEDDGNKAVIWCQDCEELLCRSCQKVHQSFKVTRGHTVLDVDHSLPNPEDEVKYCSIHKRYPLDTYDKICKTLICLRCLRDDHADHETIDIEKFEDIYRTTLRNQLKEISSVESHEEMMLKKTMTRMTSIETYTSEMKSKVAASFQTLRQRLDQREQEVLNKLEEQTQQCQQDAKLKKVKIMSNQAECKRVKEYVTSVLGYPNLRDVLQIKAAIEDKMRRMVSTKSKVDRLCSLPNFNPSGEDTLKSFITYFGDVEFIQKDIPETVPVQLRVSSPDSEVRHLITYSRTFLLQQQFTGLSIKRPRSLTRAFPEIIPDTQFCVPESISLGVPVVPKLPVLSKNFLKPLQGVVESLKPQEAGKRNVADAHVKKQIQPATQQTREDIKSDDLRKEVDDVLSLLKESSKSEFGKTKVEDVSNKDIIVNKDDVAGTAGYSAVPQAQLPHDMSKQQPVAAAPGLMPAPSIAPQQQPGLFQQQQQGQLRTQRYYATRQPQSMHRPQRYMTPTQPNQMYPMYQYMGQTQGQGYPTTANVMVQQQGQIMFQQSQRMPTPQYIPNTQIPQLAAAAAATAQYPSQPTQQYGSTSQFQPVYYQPGGQVPIAQPARPPSGSGMTTPTGTLQKRERKPIPIIDPNSGQQVQTELGENKTTPPGGSARSTPVGRQTAENSPPPPQAQSHVQQNIAAQFAAQVAATLKPDHAHTHDHPTSDSPAPMNYTDETGALPPEFVPASVSNAPVSTMSAPEEPVAEVANTQLESAVDEPQPEPVSEPVKEVSPEPVEVEAVGSSVDLIPTEQTTTEDLSSPVDAVVDEPEEPVQEEVETAPVVEEVPPPPEVVETVVETVVSTPTVEPTPAAEANAAVVSVATISKETTPPPSESTESLPDDEPASAGNLVGKDGKQKPGTSGKKKLRDLNRRGDEKEGSDMDAFLDEEGKAQSEVSKEVVMEVKAASPVEDVKSEVKPQPQMEPVNNVAALGKENKVPQNDIDTKNSDQTEVSRKNAKNDEKSSEAPTTTEEAQEEEPDNTEDKKAPILKYKYKQDQWSPLNPEGKMQYDRDFLLQLQYSKDSMKKPDTLPNFPEIIPDKPTTKPDMGMRSGPGNYRDLPDFTPGFLRPSRGMSERGSQGGGGGSMSKRGSQQRNRGDVRVIKNVSIQLDVKLHQSENAWKPGTMKEEKKDDQQVSTDVSETKELYRKVRSILNKLTPQKFQTLIKQVQGLVIDTETRLKGVTDIIFEKAISEPAFSVAYANMCRYLLTLKVPSDTKPGESVNFRVILLTRCQREFEKDKDTQLDLDRRKKDIEEATDQKKAAEMKEELDQAVTNARRRSIGNIRFIGELFKLKMLTETIMHDCVFKLLRSRDEENLECLCRLLTTIGKELESEKAKPRMDQYFQQMKKIVSEKKVSSRCRFMLQDVIDLRDNSWKPRRDENNPKTIDQIHKDAKREAVEQNMLTALHMSQQPSQPQHHQSRHNKPARGRPGGQAGGSMEEGWNTVSSKAIRNIDRNIDVSKLRIEKNADENIQLGPARSFGGWGRGSSGGGSRASQEGEKAKAPGNRFSALSKEDDQRSRAFGRGVSPARGEGRMRGNQPGGGFNRGKAIPRSSQEQERERALASARSLVSGRTTPPSGTTSREGSRNRGGATHEMERPPAPVRELSEDEMEKKTLSIIDEYLHIQDRKEAIQCVQELNSPKTTHFFVYFAINHVLERSKQARQQTGHLLHDLINQKVISVDTYLQGLTEILQAAEDMEIDIPKIWLYLGELIGPMIQDGSVPLSFLTKACEPLKASGKAGNLMAEVLHDASQRLGHKIVAHLWRNNMMDWTDFVPQEKLQQFLKDKNLEFTVGPDSAPSTPTSKVSLEWITQNLTELLNDPKCDNEKTFDWIEANIPDEITKENKFIRALMSSVCSSAISGSGNAARVDPEVVKKWRSLLIKYLDHSPVFELQALYALQALVNSLEHPSGVLRSFFDTLYDEEIISEDAFNQWETSKEEPEGKGVALKQVVQFFAWLREGEEEEADS